jgi:hypothetical protein
VTSVSALIAPYLDEYVRLVAFDFEAQPYVFSVDATRCQTSSQWSAYCKKIFQRWSGVACPPKMLVRAPHSLLAAPARQMPLSLIAQRASFVTWLRSTDASPEVLKQAARAMRHKKETVAAELEPAEHEKEASLSSPVRLRTGRF